MKVYVPLPQVKVPLFVMPPLRVTFELLFVHVPVDAMVTIPVTVRLFATVKVVPLPIVKVPPTVKVVAVDAEAVPLKVKFPLMVETPVKVFIPLPESVKLL